MSIVALSEEEKAQLKALQDKEAAKDDDADDSEVEWWEEGPDGTRKGGRLPWSKGKSIYGKHFPDLFGEKPSEDPEGKGKKPPNEDPPKRTSERYFGNKT